MTKNFTENYTPSYFLSALGSGGLAVSFFMYLMFMVKHPDAPIPNFNHIAAVFTGTSGPLTVLVVFALAGIIYFAGRHFGLLYLNLRAYNRYRKTAAYDQLLGTPAEVSLMTIPLTLGMTVNVLFILGALFVPGLWAQVEYLFPVALLAFAGVGFYALKLFASYAVRLISDGGFGQPNDLSQLLISFTFVMIGVGFAASAAMSHNLIVSVIGIIGALIFSSLALLALVVLLTLGIQAIISDGIALEGAPSLWMLIPIMTLLGITSVRVISGISHNLLGAEPQPALVLVFLSVFVAIQILFGLIGYQVLGKMGYFKTFVKGPQKSVGSYALICPGVATVVMGMFFIEWALVKTDVISKFSLAYFAAMLPLVLVQAKTIQVLFKLNRKLLCRGRNCQAQPTEPIKPVVTPS